MFGPSIDVAIGLILVFLLFSLLQSAIMEAIASALRLRAKALEDAYIKLIEDPDRLANGASAVWAWLTGMFGRQKVRLRVASRAAGGGGAAAAASLSYADVYRHPLVGGLHSTDRPSYVPASNFALALLSVLRGAADGGLASGVEQSVAALPDGQLKTALTTLIQDAGGDWDKLKAGVENWYDSAMDRLSGDYKRFSQALGFAVALILAAACNVDAVAIAGRLHDEPLLRDQMVQQATATVAQSNAGKDAKDAVAKIQDAQTQLMSIPVVGWTEPPKLDTSLLAHVGGWLLTALAGMMGAPFWFDSLQKLVNLRSAGPKPPKDGAT